MKKLIKLITVTLCCLSVSAIPANADKKTEEQIKTGLGILGDILKGGGNSPAQKTQTQTNPVSTAPAQIENERGRGATSTPTGFSITTQHPDLKVKVKRCEVAGRTCIIDLILENVSGEDIKIYGANIFKTVAYDDEGNQYKMDETDNSKRTFFYGIGSSKTDWWQYSNIDLLNEVPTKARIQLEKVPEDATKIVRLVWPLGCEALGLGSNKPITFYNIPISREGN